MATIGTSQHESILNHDVCNILGGCPLTIDTVYSYHHKIFVDERYPSVFFCLILLTLIEYVYFSFIFNRLESNKCDTI